VTLVQLLKQETQREQQAVNVARELSELVRDQKARIKALSHDRENAHQLKDQIAVLQAERVKRDADLEKTLVELGAVRGELSQLRVRSM